MRASARRRNGDALRADDLFAFDQMIARFGAAWAEDYARLFAFFVDPVESGKLGGGRFSGTA